MSVEFAEFKGNKMIVLKRNDQDTFPFQFGLNKAKLIIAHYKEITKFVEDNSTGLE